MQKIEETIKRHAKLASDVALLIDLITATAVLESMGVEIRPQDRPLRSKVYQDLIESSRQAQCYLDYDAARLQHASFEIDRLRTFGNKTCTAMADDEIELAAVIVEQKLVAANKRENAVRVPDPEDKPCSG